MLWYLACVFNVVEVQHVAVRHFLSNGIVLSTL